VLDFVNTIVCYNNRFSGCLSYKGLLKARTQMHKWKQASTKLWTPSMETTWRRRWSNSISGILLWTVWRRNVCVVPRALQVWDIIHVIESSLSFLRAAASRHLPCANLFQYDNGRKEIPRSEVERDLYAAFCGNIGIRSGELWLWSLLSSLVLFAFLTVEDGLWYCDGKVEFS
jgi:hypothetical protein